MFDKTCNGCTSQPSSSHVLSTPRLAASIVFVRASAAGSAGSGTRASSGATLALVIVLVAQGVNTGSHGSGTKAELQEGLCPGVRVRATAAPAVTAPTPVPVAVGTVIVEGVRAMATTALAAVVVADMTGGVDSHCTQGTGTGSLHGVAHAMADLFALALAVTPDELGSTGTDQGTFREMALVVWMIVVIFTGLFADVDHAVIAAVVVVAVTATTARLGDGVTRTYFPARMAVVMYPASAMIIVRVVVEIRATDNVVVGLTGIDIDVSGCMDDYRLFANDQGSRMPPHSLQVVRRSGEAAMAVGL